MNEINVLPVFLPSPQGSPFFAAFQQFLAHTFSTLSQQKEVSAVVNTLSSVRLTGVVWGSRNYVHWPQLVNKFIRKGEPGPERGSPKNLALGWKGNPSQLYTH